MKLIKNNRDKVFWSFWILYLIYAIIFIGVLNFKAIYVHLCAIACFSIIIIIDNVCKSFNKWLNTPIKDKSVYQLTDKEGILWDSITKKADKGYSEFCEECKKDNHYMGWPWVSPYLTTEENNLLNKIHEYFYPGDYIVDPISARQADYIWYEDIKYKVKYSTT